jgi:hypothetical protein
MRYQTQIKIPKGYITESFGDSNDIETIIIRKLIHKLIQDLPIDKIKNLFKLKKIDPSDRDKFKELFRNKSPHELEELRLLERDNLIKFEVEITIN